MKRESLECAGRGRDTIPVVAARALWIQHTESPKYAGAEHRMQNPRGSGFLETIFHFARGVPEVLRRRGERSLETKVR